MQRQRDTGSVRARRRTWVVAAFAVLMLVGAELGVRSIESRILDEPEWGIAEIDLKIGQMGGLGGAAVVVVGSSVGGVAVDPDRLERDGVGAAYVASIIGSSPRMWEPWLTEVVFEALEPEIVVLVVSPRDLNDAGSEQARAMASYEGSRGRAELLGFDEPWHVSFLSRFALVNRRGQLRSPSVWVRLLGLADAPASVEIIGPRGENLTHRDQQFRATTEFRRRAASLVLNDYLPGGREIQSLDRTIDAIRRVGATPVLVDMVILESELGDQRLHALFAEARASLAETAMESGTVLLHPPPTLEDRRFFADPFHFNGEGTMAFSEWLGAELRAIGAAP